jgi:hypothetical protein
MRCALTVLLALAYWAPAVASAGEVLYNGIELPSPWPPRIKEFKPPGESDPVVPPYLQ